MEGSTAPATFQYMQGRVGDIGRILALAVLYFVFARLGLSLGSVAGFVALVWAPTGIAIAALLLFGNRLWPGILLGSVASSLFTPLSLPVAVGIGIGNTVEVVVATWLMRRLPRFDAALEDVRSVTRFLLAALVGTILGATLGVVSLRVGGIIGVAASREAWRAWWVGDMVGALTAAPIILVWSRAPSARFSSSRVERIALVAAVAIVSVAIFFGDVFFQLPAAAGPFHQADVLLAVLVWSALRFGQRGIITTAFCIGATGTMATVHFHGPFAQGELGVNLMSLQTFVATGLVIFLLFGATIDERRCALAAARESYRAASLANRAKSEFLAIMSHELRTPLNAIAGYSQLMEEGVYGPLNEKQADGVARIHVNEQRLLSLIDEVLGYVSAEKGLVAMRSESIRVVDALDAVQPLVASELEAHHLVLERLAIGAGLTVQADSKSLQQILMRLLSNASKYNADGGKVTLGAEREGDRVRIWIRDTGVGISQEALANVFEPFFQAERATTRRVSGIGLGLTIARHLARRMDGDVSLSSEPGHGTTASVLLPAA